MKKVSLLLIACMFIAACSAVPSAISSAVNTPVVPAIATTIASALPDTSEVPGFDHIVLILLENRGYDSVINGNSMPHLKELAQQNVLLTNYFAVAHPSLPNYLALVSGTTSNIKSDCTNCFVDHTNLADLLDQSGRTWKAYGEDMPSPCYVGDAKPYYQKHNPFIYFNSIRLNSSRCDRSIVPLSELDSDLAANQLPNFTLIIPNNCNSGHSCPPETADNWLFGMVSKLQASSALGQKSLIIVTFDEGSDGSKASCCGMGSAGGQVAAILISPLARHGFQDNTPYSHYSLLKTILMAWKLPDIGETSPSSTQPIVAPWIPGSK